MGRQNKNTEKNKVKLQKLVNRNNARKIYEKVR